MYYIVYGSSVMGEREKSRLFFRSIHSFPTSFHFSFLSKVQFSVIVLVLIIFEVSFSDVTRNRRTSQICTRKPFISNLISGRKPRRTIFFQCRCRKGILEFLCLDFFLPVASPSAKVLLSAKSKPAGSRSKFLQFARA